MGKLDLPVNYRAKKSHVNWSIKNIHLYSPSNGSIKKKRKNIHTYEIKRHRTYMAKYWMPFAIIGPYRAIRRGHFGGIMFGGCCPGFRGSASLLLALGRVNRLPVALLLVFRAAWRVSLIQFIWEVSLITRGVQKVRRLTQLTTRYAYHVLSLFNIDTCN